LTLATAGSTLTSSEGGVGGDVPKDLRSGPIRAVGAVVVLLFCEAAAHAATLASDTFESGDAGDYFVRFGAPDLVSPTGPFTSSSLRLNCFGNHQPNFSSGFFYDQIQYDLASRPLQVEVSFDVFTSNYIGVSNMLFVMLIDAPFVQRLDFRPSGQIIAFGRPIGTFTDGQPLHVTSVFRAPENSYEVYLNDVLAFSGTAYQPQDVRSVRFSLGAESEAFSVNGSASVFIDNVMIDSLVPVPPAMWLLGTALAVLRAMGFRKPVS
jgi:hypothetical protein